MARYFIVDFDQLKEIYKMVFFLLVSERHALEHVNFLCSIWAKDLKNSPNLRKLSQKKKEAKESRKLKFRRIFI